MMFSFFISDNSSDHVVLCSTDSSNVTFSLLISKNSYPPPPCISYALVQAIAGCGDRINLPPPPLAISHSLQSPPTHSPPGP